MSVLSASEAEMSYIETYSGKKIDFFDPQPDQIELTDIALGLSRLPRFSGQTKEFYSVAQHSLNVCSILPKKFQLQGLMHDAAEAFIGDMPTPFKRNIPQFEELEKRIWWAICQKLNLPFYLDPLVKQADSVMLVSERDVLKPAVTDWGEYENNLRVPVNFRNTPQGDVYTLFIRKFGELIKGE